MLSNLVTDKVTVELFLSKKIEKIKKRIKNGSEYLM